MKEKAKAKSTKKKYSYPKIACRCGDALRRRADAIIEKSNGHETDSTILRHCLEKSLVDFEIRYGLAISK